MPAAVAVPNPALDDSDDNVSLDLHVSDTEDGDGANASEKDKASDEVPMEVEDELLNKFELDLEEKAPSPPQTSPSAEPTVNENVAVNGTTVEEAKIGDDVSEEAKIDDAKSDGAKSNEAESDEAESDKSESVEVKSDEAKNDAAKSDDSESNDAKEESMVIATIESAEKAKIDEDEEPKEEEPKNEEPKNEEPKNEEPEIITTSDEVPIDEEPKGAAASDDVPIKTEAEGEDFLQVMEEKTTEEDETDFINDTETDNGGGGETSETGEDFGKEKDQTSDTSGNVSPAPTANAEDNIDETMDIEECGLEGTIITTHEVEETPEGLNIIIEDKVVVGSDSDNNEKDKEEEIIVEDEPAKTVETEKSVLEAILVSSPAVASTKTTEVTTTKPVNKRLLPESAEKEEPPKKAKLSEGDEKKSADVDDVKKLGSFRKYMLDKSLKGLTRDQLEVFCVQKMCECIVQKSEIGELKMKIKMHEQLLDLLRKEAVLLGKQTRDLNIVHQKVIQDVGRIKENPDKPLIVPKITRSVGLQAVVRDEASKRKQQTAKPASPANNRSVLIGNNRSPRSAPAAPTTPVGRAVQATVNRYSTPQSKPATPTLNRSLQSSKTAVVQNKAAPANASSLNSKATEPRSNGVIDLTDEDDKKTTTATPTTPSAAVVANNNKSTSASTPNGTKVNLINNANGQRLVVMPNGQTVMVKLAPPNSLVVTQPILRTVQQTANNSANNVVRTINSNQVLRTVSQPVRTGINNSTRGGRGGGQAVRARAPYNAQPQQLAPKPFKHPAPLPNPPAPKPDVYSMKPVPPKPQLMLNKTQCGSGIVLSWKMPYNLDMFEVIASYQLYAYQETKSEPRTDSWGKIGDVKALELPMAVTLTQFAVGNRYYFAVRAVDVLTRHGAFSDYQTILL